MDMESSGWERKLLEKLALESLIEQRRKRRWGIFFKFLGFTYIAVLLVMFTGVAVSGKSAVGRHTALVDLRGVIDSEGPASADKIIGGLQSAFADTNSAGVVLRINSPGGSPVQSGMIYDEIRRLRQANPKTPFYVVVEEICASGGYYVASAADKIFVDKASLIGSIGVLMDGFGFEEAMKKVGVERRLMTAGENKGFMDPFSPQNPKQREFIQTMLNEIHQQFIKAVKDGRGERLKETPEMFTGLIWNGVRGVEMGLADELGTLSYIAREVIKAPDVIDYTEQENFAERFAKRVGATFGQSVSTSVFPRQGVWR